MEYFKNFVCLLALRCYVVDIYLGDHVYRDNAEIIISRFDNASAMFGLWNNSKQLQLLVVGSDDSVIVSIITPQLQC